jgi:acyl-coenzyme A synthetase/AMP-(fatty) acid ligase
MAGSGNLAARLEDACRKGGWEGRVAYRCGAASHSHAEVHEGAARFAGFLAHRCAPGARVLISLPDGIAFVWAFLGAVRAGAVALPVAPPEPGAPTDVADRLGAELVIEDAEAVVAAVAGSEPLPAAPVAGPAYGQMTSGTTGAPRVALHGHDDPFVFQAAFGGPVLGLRPGETVLSVSKLFFAYGLGNSLFYPLLAGATAVMIEEKPTPASVARLVAAHRVDVLFAVPSFYGRLVGDGHGAELRGLRLAISAGEALPGRLREAFEAAAATPLLDGIGSTEVGQCFASNRPGAARPGTVGRPLPPYRVRVVDPGDGTPLPAGAEGLLEVAGPTLAAGFLDAGGPPPGGWLRTTDLGLLDADGFLHLRGRVDEVEIVSGRKLRPGEVEERVGAHPRVREVAVCAVPDEHGVARLTAFVAAQGEVGEEKELAAELLALGRDDDGAGRALRAVVFVTALPRTPTGKVMRFRLRQGTAG